MAVDLKKIPETPGIYKFFQKSEIIYIGKAKNLKKRVSSYFGNSKKDRKTTQIKLKTDQIETFSTKNEVEALLLEQSLIRENKPKFNILLRDDKTYPYIFFSDEHDYPYIGLKRTKKAVDKRYFGPFISSYAVKKSIKEIQKIFKIRNCSDTTFSSRSRPCIEYQMNRCSAPCVGNVTKNQYAEDLIDAKNFLSSSDSQTIARLNRELAKHVHNLNFEGAAEIRDKLKRINIIQEEQAISTKAKDVDIFSVAEDNGYLGICIVVVRKGKIRGTKTHLIKKAYYQDIDEVYENAIFNFYYSHNDIAKNILLATSIQSSELIMEGIYKRFQSKVKVITTPRKEIRPIFNLCKSNAKQVIANHVSKEDKYSYAIEELRALLGMHKISKIEAYDISHLNQDNGVASCVVFSKRGSSKKDYRLFNIPRAITGNDIGSLEHAITRRLKYYDQKNTKPDLLLIDGGRPQLKYVNNVIKKSPHKDIKVISIVKGINRVRATETILAEQGIVEMGKNSKAFLLLQEIRDEAHRFAIMAQRRKKQKFTKKSSLDQIAGIGPITKAKLLKKFGSIKAIKEASKHELMTIKGINEKIADEILLEKK